MFNNSKIRQKPLNDVPEFMDAHFRSTTDTDNKKTELLCGYLFSESDNKLYAVSGTNKGGSLNLRKSQIRVGSDGILHWSAFLAQMEEQYIGFNALVKKATF
jgi:hypothetical protein